MVDASLIAIDLTELEREFIADALYAWRGPAGWTPLPIEALGLSNWDEFDALTDRLRDAVTRGEPFTDLDGARALFLTEITWPAVWLARLWISRSSQGFPTLRRSRCCEHCNARSAIRGAPICFFPVADGPATPKNWNEKPTKC